ncbi:MAG: hypothetical protein NTZ13_00075 [Candidatus Parcubacteria bacterium]|nr:hypothetical protein [Candidatus Parcubacteria bacterium]
MSVVNKKLRLSNEKATKETIHYLNEKLRIAHLVNKEKTNAVDKIVSTLIIAILNDLLVGIHVLTKTQEADHYEIIHNNYVNALAAEFPDLVL